MASVGALASFVLVATKGLVICNNSSSYPIISNCKINSIQCSKCFRSTCFAVVKTNEADRVSTNKMGLSVADCEAVVIGGNVSEVLFVPSKPEMPAGTPEVSSISLSRRPRRNRKSPALRASFQETNLSPANLVYPLFIQEGEEDTQIGAMPGCLRLGWSRGLVDEVSKARDVGINNIILFPKVPDSLKTPIGDEAYNEDGLVPRSIRLLRDQHPDLVIYTDVALDLYSSDGHDGIIREDAGT